jgi:hypothetical protein
MSRNSVLLGRAGVNTLPPRAEQSSSSIEGPLPSGEYRHLIRRLFAIPSVVAIGGSGPGDDVRKVCDGIAAELAACGKRVVVVPVATALAVNPMEIPDETAFVPGSAPNTWVWPPSNGNQIEFFKYREPVDQESWVGALRRDFDAVLLDCPALGTTPGVGDVMALADAAVLVVEDGRTSKRQLQRDQRALELRGAKLTGCILIKRR